MIHDVVRHRSPNVIPARQIFQLTPQHGSLLSRDCSWEENKIKHNNKLSFYHTRPPFSLVEAWHLHTVNWDDNVFAG